MDYEHSVLKGRNYPHFLACISLVASCLKNITRESNGDCMSPVHVSTYLSTHVLPEGDPVSQRVSVLCSFLAMI
jgi:hypothetical protein